MKGKRRFRGLRERMRGWSMRRKMINGFCVPVLLAIVAVYIPSMVYMQRHAFNQQRQNTEQAMTQAGSFISSYIQTLRYIAEQLNSSRELSLLLESPEFGKRDHQDAYLEFWTLQQLIQRFELAHGEYRIGLYVPDEVSYSSNRYNVYPLSELEEMADYDDIITTLESDGTVFRIFQDKRTGDPISRQDYLALLRMLKVTRTDGAEKEYIIKTEVRLGQLEDVLNTASPTAHSTLYLLTSDGEVICSNERGEDESLRSAQVEKRADRLRQWTRLGSGTDTVYAIHQDVEGTAWSIAGYVPVAEYYMQMLWLFGMLLLILAAVFAVVLLVAYYLSGYYAGRIGNLNGRMADFGKEDLNQKLEVPKLQGSRDEMDILYANFDFMIGEIQKLMKEEYRLGRDVSKMEVKALQAQINPHFLYNTLDLINWGALEYGADDVAAIARNLGQFYRLSLNHGSSVILIKDEIRHVQAFVNIENEHYDHSIHLEVNVPEDLLDYACLNITLQPFVENSILHGIGEHQEIKECRIGIFAERQGEDILFAVSDDGPGMDASLAEQLSTQHPDGHSRGFGIANVNFRIKLVYGEKYGVSYKTWTAGNMEDSKEEEDSSEGETPAKGKNAFGKDYTKVEDSSEGCTTKVENSSMEESSLPKETDKVNKKTGTIAYIRVKALKLEELEKII